MDKQMNELFNYDSVVIHISIIIYTTENTRCQ